MQGRSDDVNEILNAVFRYARGLDLHDPEEAVAAFTSDGVWDASAVGLICCRGRAELLDFFASDATRMREQYHVNTNHIVEFDGPDQAHGTNLMLTEGTTTDGILLKGSVMMHDRYRRENGRWAIEERRITWLTGGRMQGGVDAWVATARVVSGS